MQNPTPPDPSDPAITAASRTGRTPPAERCAGAGAEAAAKPAGASCKFEINIDARGDVNIPQHCPTETPPTHRTPPLQAALAAAHDTSADFPLPDASAFIAEGDIEVKVKPQEKIPTQYRELREYVSDDEDSRYEILFRFNRTA